MKAPRPLEKEILSQCRNYLRLLGFKVWRINNGAFAGEHKGKKRFVRFTDTPGISDLHAIKHTKDGMIYLAVETKRPGGKVSTEQTAFLEDVRRHGGLGFVVDSLDSLRKQLEEHGL